MGAQGFHSVKCDAFLIAANLATQAETAGLPMLTAILIGKGLRALVTRVLSCIEGLHYESIDLLAQVELSTTIWTSSLPLLPLRDARAAAKLVAVLAFLRIFDDHDADGTGEVLIELSCSLL